MISSASSWLRTCASAVAGCALVFGVAAHARANSLVAVYEKSGFEYIVSLGPESSFTSVSFNANISQFGGSTSGALFTIVSVVDRNLADEFSVPIPNIVFTKTGAFPALSDNAIGQAQNLVAPNGGSADAWFDLLPTIANGPAGTFKVVAATDPTAFEVKVGNDFFSAFPFATTGTIDASGNLHIGLYSAIASDAFTGADQIVSLLHNINVTSGGVAVPEPTGLIGLGIALASLATLRRRAA